MRRSAHAEYFNHDSEALDYDQDVTNEAHPVRTGYEATLRFVGSHILESSNVLDLGCGTGNTILRLPHNCRVCGVDVSRKMIEIAREKLSDRQVTFVVEDILQYVNSNDLRPFDAIISTYALHHLTPSERAIFFQLIRQNSRPDVALVIGDLMYRDEDDLVRIIEKYRSTHPELLADISDEFFWNLKETENRIDDLGWSVQWKGFSDLSWVGVFSRAPE